MVQVKKEEEEYHMDLAKEVGHYSFSDCRAVQRSASVQGRITGPTRHSTRGGWTEEEDDLLTKLVRNFYARNWKKIARYLPGRTVSQCFNSWKRVLNPEIFKGPWTKEEDDYIEELVKKYDCHRWSVVAKSLPGRTCKQC